ncbi:hypothetical protein [Mycobacterium sp. OTB74]|jgi:hypothetical protein|nr:hypothetical protein [Mycobacterium sp. OTB74]MDH6242645.1 hypothetical protein [Mycobacterium sp. OTB74]
MASSATYPPSRKGVEITDITAVNLTGTANVTVPAAAGGSGGR